MLHPIPNIEIYRSKLDGLYKARKTEIIRKLSGKKFYLVIDENQKNDKKYLNVIVGLVERPFIEYLINCREKKFVNSGEIVSSVHEVMGDYDLRWLNFTLLLSDAARYMIKAGSELKKKHVNLYHVTCFAYLIHNCAFKIKSWYKNVDKLIACIKRLVCKSNDRKGLFQNIPLPPETTVTR